MATNPAQIRGLTPWGPGQSGNARGHSQRTIKRIVNLALDIRENVSAQQVREWLVKCWYEGQDPTTGDKLNIEFRKSCLDTLLNRGWGQAAQHVVIEGLLKQELVVSQAVELPSDIDEVRKRRDALRSAGVKKKVIDVAGKEVPASDVTEDAEKR